MVVVTFSDIPPPGILEQKTRVKEDGTLSLPYGVNVNVVGPRKKIGDVEKEVVAAYVPKYFKQLTVTIKADDRLYWVGGEVKQSGAQFYRGPTTLVRARALPRGGRAI